MQDKKMLDILFVTDFVCPYCLVAKEALNQALKEGGVKAKIRIYPLELTEEPKERIDTYHDQNRKERYQVLKKPAEELGLAMKFPPAVVPRPYTKAGFSRKRRVWGTLMGIWYTRLILLKKKISGTWKC